MQKVIPGREDNPLCEFARFPMKTLKVVFMNKRLIRRVKRVSARFPLYVIIKVSLHRQTTDEAWLRAIHEACELRLTVLLAMWSNDREVYCLR